jgi:hypothetical protein
VTKGAAKLASEQDLRAKDQYVRFVEGYFHFLEPLSYFILLLYKPNVLGV